MGSFGDAEMPSFERLAAKIGFVRDFSPGMNRNIARRVSVF
jgi:hypothetical protein